MGQPVSEADRKLLTIQKLLGGSRFLLLKVSKTNNPFCQKICCVINDTENFLSDTLYKLGFYKISPKWESFLKDLGLIFTLFAEIIRLITQADRNTCHYFQVWVLSLEKRLELGRFQHSAIFEGFWTCSSNQTK